MQYKGCQNIYSLDGEVLFDGGWDSRELYKAVTGDLSDVYWMGRRVLDIGANTSGLSIEIARRGATVIAAEPDPFKNTRHLAQKAIFKVMSEEGLKLELKNEGIFETKSLGHFDTVLCLGLVYHFRDQQFVLDYLSTINCDHLIISNQTSPGDQLSMINRMDASVPVPKDFWAKYTDPLSGWHPTRPMFERMLKYAGFDDVVPITDPTINYPKKPFDRITNSSYYRARRVKAVDPVASRYVYLPR